MNQCRQSFEVGFPVLSSCGNISKGVVFNEEFTIRYERHKFYGEAGLTLSTLPSGIHPSKAPNGPSMTKEGSIAI